jgi:hypothetical protein
MFFITLLSATIMMSATCEYTLRENISLTEVDDEVVLLDLSNGAYYGLNQVGADLLKALQNKQPLCQTIRQISEHYQMDSAQVKIDIDELLQELLVNNLLRRTP